jgi:hypothetical protein
MSGGFSAPFAAGIAAYVLATVVAMRAPWSGMREHA